MASKGKGIAGKDSSGKRKRPDNDKGGGQKRKNRDVLQFFEDSAFEADGLDSSDDGDDLFGDDGDFLDDLDVDPKVKSEPGEEARLFPKEEELSGDELEKLLQERYKSGSGYVRYSEDAYDNKRSVDRSFHMPSVSEPTIWKVKCKVGRERHSVFCLMQKYVDLKELGTKLQIISAFAVEHIKGFVFIEAEKQSDVIEACNQLADLYISLVTKVPMNEVSQLMVVRKRYHEVKEGTWARVKNGIYKGDIAQVVAVSNERKRATVKLIPRVDLQALAGKYGGAAVAKKSRSAVPAARLISSSELEEFRPLMQCRRDRDTGKYFEFLDGLMLKDGFLYKKVSIDSLSFWDVNPTEEELQKFALPSTDDSDNLDWLSQLYGEQKKKTNVVVNKVGEKGGGKGGGKGEGTSGSNEQSSFEVHDLVLFGKREFGMVIGMEKDESYKILKNGSEGPETLALGEKDLKYVPNDKKFTAVDHRMKNVFVNDTVKIVNGPTKGRQGTVKQIYRGIIFLYDENDFDNAYFCANSRMSEKVKLIDSACSGKAEEGPSGFEDVPSSPKSPLSAKKPWQMREERGDKEGMLSVGQSLRIRIGPLKGYLCRVLAVRYTDVTVKLDSQQKVLTVKRDHLSEVRGKSSATSMSDGVGLNSSFKPFDLLGSDGGANDWLQGATGSGNGDGWNVASGSASGDGWNVASGSGNGDGWNVAGLSGERSAWPSISSEGAAVQAGTSAVTLPSAVDNDSGKDVNDAWLSKAKSSQNSSWAAAGSDKAVGNSDQVGAWGTSDGWGKSSGTGASSSWGAKAHGADDGGSWKVGGSSVKQGKEDDVGQADPWNKQTAEKGTVDTWNKGKGSEEGGGWSNNVSSGNAGSSGWGKKTCGEGTESVKLDLAKPGGDAWGEGKGTSDPAQESWGKAAGKWGNKSSTNVNSEWKTSAAASESKAGGWGQAKEQSASGSGGWKNNSLGEDSNGKWGSKDWGKGGDSSQGVPSWSKPEGINSWDQSRGGENDQMYGGRGSGGRRGRSGPGGSRGGRDQSGRGRGGFFDQGKSSSWNPKDQAGSSWGTSDGWGKSSGTGGSSSWGGKAPGGDDGGSWKVGGSSVGQGKEDNISQADPWNKQQTAEKGTVDTWNKGKGSEEGGGWSNIDSGNDVDDAWPSKAKSNQNSSWGAAGSDKAVGNSDQVGARGTGDGWGKKSGTGTSSSWGAKAPGGDDGGSWKVGGSSVDQGKEDNVGQADPWNKQTAEKGTVDTWNKRKGSEEGGGWSNNVSSGNAGSSVWGKMTCGEGTESVKSDLAKAGGDAWGEGKGTTDPAQDSWGKAASKWGNNSSTNVSSKWKTSAAASESKAGGWGQAQEQGAVGSGGWKNNSLGEDSNEKWGSRDWGKGGDSSQGVQSWSKPQGIRSWDQSRGGENDQGYGGRGWSGGRRGRGGPDRGRGGRGRDQSGRGRGGFFNQGQSSSWNQENQAGSSWGTSSDRNKDQGSGWGKDRGSSWGKDQGSSWGKDQGSGSGKDQGSGWGKDEGSGSGKDQGSGWGNSKGWN